MKKFINLTPHEICIVLDNGRPGDDWLRLAPTRPSARVDSAPGVRIQVGDCDVPLYTAPTWGEVVGLPAPQPDTIYIVSALVAARCVGRSDVFSPGTGPNDDPIRNTAGQITAVRRLIQAPQS